MSGLLYVWLGERVDFLGEYRKLNWAPFVLGAVILGLEAGWIYAYKAGWPMSTAFIVQSSVLAAALLLLFFLLLLSTVVKIDVDIGEREEYRFYINLWRGSIQMQKHIKLKRRTS